MARVSAAILGLICFPVLVILAERLPTGTARSLCSIAAGAAAIGAVALIAEFAELRVDPRARGRSADESRNTRKP